MKKAFNLSELLIAIAIIGIVSALIIPMVSYVDPHRDKIMYKKAVYSLSSAISAVMETNATVAAGDGLKAIAGTGDGKLCAEVCKQMNTLGSCSCGSAGSYASPNFTTLDGLKYWNLTASFTTDNTNGDYIDICTDYTMSRQDRGLRIKYRGTSNNGCGYTVSGTQLYGFKLRIRKAGKIATDTDANGFAYENKLLKDEDTYE